MKLDKLYSDCHMLPSQNFQTWLHLMCNAYNDRKRGCHPVAFAANMIQRNGESG